MKSKHDLRGNCPNKTFSCRRCGTENKCDVCHTHEEPRGECSECPICPGCAVDFPAATMETKLALLKNALWDIAHPGSDEFGDFTPQKIAKAVLKKVR